MVEPALFGKDLFGDQVNQVANGKLAENFIVPPFSVMNAREGWWQERKRAWIDLGIESELGRVAKAFQIHDWLDKNKDVGGACGSLKGGGTSIFDPVLCELAYRWFSPEGGQIVDPFAGGSVRGVVAAMLNRKYWGAELRSEQVEANRAQAAKICPNTPPRMVPRGCGGNLRNRANGGLYLLLPTIWKLGSL